jgi:nucleotide-binding universal stress UspA family protein
VEEAAAKVRAEGVSVETYVWPGDAASAIIDVATTAKADVIVVGSRGMSGPARFLLGSVPNKVSHHAPCNVLIVRTC